MSDKTKYPKNFIEWLDLDTEESARKAQETQATPEVLVGSNKEDNDDDNDKVRRTLIKVCVVVDVRIMCRRLFTSAVRRIAA